MKLAYLAAIAALTISSPAFCQSTTVTTTGAASSTSVIVAPEQRTKIRTYITEHKVRPVVVKEKVAVGAVLPADVELHAVPEDWVLRCTPTDTSIRVMTSFWSIPEADASFK